jgi:molybdopterin converting factor small subunit
MAVTVIIPNALRPYAGGVDRIPIDGTTVGDTLQKLVQRYPHLEGRLPAQAGPGQAIYRNGRMIQTLQGLETPVGDDDTLTIIVPEGWL